MQTRDDKFNYVIDNILNPIFEKNEEDIQKIFSENAVFRAKVEEKMAMILKARSLKKAAKSVSIEKVEKSKELSGFPIAKNGRLFKGILQETEIKLLNVNYLLKSEKDVMESVKYESKKSLGNVMSANLINSFGEKFIKINIPMSSIKEDIKNDVDIQLAV